MPKKTNKKRMDGRGRVEDNHYFGHDDRVNRDEVRKVSNRQVSFNVQAHKGPSRKFKPKLGYLRSFRDDDDTMSGPSSKGKATNNFVNKTWMRMKKTGYRYTKGRNSPVPYIGDSHRPRGISGETSWYKIIIQIGFDGMRFSKEDIMNRLQNATRMLIVPIMWKETGDEVIFYIDDKEVAKAILTLENIKMDNGTTLYVGARPEIPCSADITEQLKEKLKLAMAKRYRPDTKALDLSKFYRDPDLVDSYFCGLFRAPMLIAVLDIVSEHIQDLEALNLDGNKLMVIDRLRVLENKFPKLKILHMGDNRIKEVHQLFVLKDLKIEEVRLEGNPLCNRYKKNREEYVSSLRKIFPKLVRLDGQDLPPPIHFDVVDDGVKLPSSKPLYVANEEVQKIASQFIQQYFLVYDGENRQPLLDAYHEHTCFSLTVSAAASQSSRLAPYISENRNLYRIVDRERRRKLLKQGRLPVVTFISELPKTKHDFNSFTMDVSIVSNAMMLVTVTGLFKEIFTKDGKEPIRYFNRTFVIVPQGTGYCISNEALFISTPSERQEREMRKQTTVLPSTSLEAATSIPVAAVPVACPVTMMPNMEAPQPTEEVKQQMALTLSQQTNMNLEWSLKCLIDVKWNYDIAIAAFQELFSTGRVPPEAFKK